MFRVKRTKTTVVGREADGREITRAAVHYATKIEPNGAVTGYSVIPADTQPILQSAAEKVRAYYATRPKAGTFEFEPVKATADQLLRAEAGATAMANEDFRRLQDECSRFRAENQKLREANDAVREEVGKLNAAVAEAQKLAASREEEIAKLSARVAELSSELEAATPKPKSEPEKPGKKN